VTDRAADKNNQEVSKIVKTRCCLRYWLPASPLRQSRRRDRLGLCNTRGSPQYITPRARLFVEGQPYQRLSQHKVPVRLAVDPGRRRPRRCDNVIQMGDDQIFSGSIRLRRRRLPVSTSEGYDKARRSIRSSGELPTGVVVPRCHPQYLEGNTSSSPTSRIEGQAGTRAGRLCAARRHLAHHGPAEVPRRLNAVVRDRHRLGGGELWQDQLKPPLPGQLQQHHRRQQAAFDALTPKQAAVKQASAEPTDGS
jgi:hypothetical protein